MQGGATEMTEGERAGATDTRTTVARTKANQKQEPTKHIPLPPPPKKTRALLTCSFTTLIAFLLTCPAVNPLRSRTVRHS